VSLYLEECVISRLDYLEQQYPVLGRSIIADIMLAGIAAVAGAHPKEVAAAQGILRAEAGGRTIEVTA
jgi:hypothetical protein